MKGRTIEPYWFPLGQDDVHPFDFHVSPQYRSRRINPFLVTYILQNVATEGAGRAFLEAAEWNQAELSSPTKTPFRRLGLAVKLTIFRRTIVRWTENETVQQARKRARGNLPHARGQKDAG